MDTPRLHTRPDPARTYCPVLDEPRLTNLRDRVHAMMCDGHWRTLAEIQAQTGGSETGVSAKLRDLRKPQFGGHYVDARRRGDARDGLWEYRLIESKGCAK